MIKSYTPVCNGAPQIMEVDDSLTELTAEQRDIVGELQLEHDDLPEKLVEQAVLQLDSTNVGMFISATF